MTFFERHLLDRLQDDEKRTNTVIILFTCILVVLIGYMIFITVSYKKEQQLLQKQITVASILPQSPSPTETICTTCISSTPIPSIQQTIPAQTLQTAVKDYYIPLGSGTSQATNWTDVPGVQTITDFSQYTNIQHVYFEASVNLPTTNQSVSVRLYNVTDNHPVWGSTVVMNSGTSAFLVSSPISYDTGQKTYQVQLQTQLQAPANLVNARIHIVLQ